MKKCDFFSLGGFFGVMKLFVFVISECNSFIIIVNDVVGVDGDFSASARSVDNILGDGVARCVSAESLNDGNSFFDACAKVGGAFDEIALVEVVGADPADE